MDTLQKEGCIVMKIQAVLIDGFKNLSNVKIGFDNITALVALNNFGKSNVLAAIDFGLKFIKATVEDKADMMANSNLIPINSYMFGRNYKFQMEILTELDDICLLYTSCGSRTSFQSYRKAADLCIC